MRKKIFFFSLLFSLLYSCGNKQEKQTSTRESKAEKETASLPDDETLAKLCKTWVAFEYRETDGRIYPVPDEMKNDYLKINPDGTFESLESGEILVKGTWQLNSESMELTCTQHQTDELASSITSKITNLTETELTTEGLDGGGETIVIFLRVKEEKK
jgi:hypothetical protein